MLKRFISENMHSRNSLLFYLFLAVALSLSTIATSVEDVKGEALEVSGDEVHVSSVGTPTTSLSSVKDPCLLTSVYCEGEKIPTIIRGATITAYNTIESQTDSSPCIAASGDNICGRQDAVACPRSIPLGTRVSIAGSDYTCLDRTAMKYNARFDISFDKDIKGALIFGKQTHDVLVYE